MITNEEIKSNIFDSSDSSIPFETKYEIIKRFLFDKTNTEIDFNEPYGKPCMILTFQFAKLITDYDILEYMYFCSIKYFKRTSNK